MTILKPFWMVRIRILLVLITLGPPSLGACGSTGSIDLNGPTRSQPEVITVQGTVTATNDGRPVASVTVEQLFFDGELEAQGPKVLTDAEGRYNLVEESSCDVCIAPLFFTLVAHLDGFDGGFEPRRERVPSESWAQGEVGDTVFFNATQNFALRPTRPVIVNIRGRVTDGPGGQPIETVKVTITNQPWGNVSYHVPFEVPRDSAETDAEGHYFVESKHFCAITGSSCSLSLYVRAEKDDLLEGRIVKDMSVPDDSLSLTVNFEGLE